MIYRMNAKIEFDIEADNRADAHIEATSRLIEADLAGFDLVKLHIAPALTREQREWNAQHFAAANSRPDFSSLDPTPLRVEGTLTASESSTDEQVDRFGELAGKQEHPTV